jgi:beta-aspartyl-dipeptidase (metallo-type)
MITLIKEGHLFAPEDIGNKDLLIINGKIERIDNEIAIPINLFKKVEMIPAEGKFIFPGFIDQHVHIIGGGDAGPFGRVREIFGRDIIKAGVTTIVGTLGYDTISRSLSSLLYKIKVLKRCGFNAFMYTGSLIFPAITLTGSVERDIGLIEEVIGVKMGLGEPSFPRPDLRELENLIIETRRGGLHSRKPTIVHIHLPALGNEWIEVVEEIIERREIPYHQIVLTHVNKTPELLERASKYAKKGGRIDLTTCIRPPERPTTVKPSTALKQYLNGGGPLNNITFSSDGNSSRVLANGVIDYTRIGTPLEELRDCVEKEGISLPCALATMTSNAADRLGIANQHGRLREGFSADLALFSKDLELTDLMAGGKWLLRDGVVAKLDPFE